MLRRRHFLFLVPLMFSAVLPLDAQDVKSSADTRPGVAVFPFFNGGSYGAGKEDMSLLQVGLQQALMYELAANSAMRVIDRSTLKELMQEQDLGATERVSPETAAKIGKIVGARYVVTGGYMDLSGKFQLTGRIVDVETSEVVKSAQVQGKKDQLFGLIVDMAADVTKGVKLPALPPAQAEARRKRAVPSEALVRHAMILSVLDEGDKTRAIDLYGKLVADFPQVEEWQSELRQLETGS